MIQPLTAYFWEEQRRKRNKAAKSLLNTFKHFSLKAGAETTEGCREEHCSLRNLSVCIYILDSSWDWLKLQWREDDRRGQGSNAISWFLPACNRADVRPFRSCSRQAQQCSFQISEVLINHFPQSSMVDSFTFCDVRGEGIQFLWYIFMRDLSLLTQQHALRQLTNKPYHRNRSISALRSILSQLRDVSLDSQAPKGSVQIQYWPQVTSVSGERAEVSLHFVWSHTPAKTVLCFPSSSIRKA